MEIRLLLANNFIFLSSLLTIIIIIIFDLDFGYLYLAMMLTYSLCLNDNFTEMIKFLCEVETRMVSVERIRHYFDNK
jgi:hypothetical protein